MFDGQVFRDDMQESLYAYAQVRDEYKEQYDSDGEEYLYINEFDKETLGDDEHPRFIGTILANDGSMPVVMFSGETIDELLDDGMIIKSDVNYSAILKHFGEL